MDKQRNGKQKEADIPIHDTTRHTQYLYYISKFYLWWFMRIYFERKKEWTNNGTISKRMLIVSYMALLVILNIYIKFRNPSCRVSDKYLTEILLERNFGKKQPDSQRRLMLFDKTHQIILNVCTKFLKPLLEKFL